MGTTQADYFRGDIPVTRMLTEQEVSSEYEANTGRVIVETFVTLDPVEVPAALVACHGPFAWGRDPDEAVRNAVLLESLARMQVAARTLDPDSPKPPTYLIDRHYLRKHGDNAYYGQKDKPQ